MTKKYKFRIQAECRSELDRMSQDLQTLRSKQKLKIFKNRSLNFL